MILGRISAHKQKEASTVFWREKSYTETAFTKYLVPVVSCFMLLVKCLDLGDEETSSVSLTVRNGWMKVETLCGDRNYLKFFITVRLESQEQDLVSGQRNKIDLRDTERMESAEFAN